MELKPSPLSTVIYKLFDRLEREYSLNRPTQIADEDLLELYGVFGVILQDALDIIDREQITIFRRASDQREYIEISEHQHNIFKLLPNINYCTCSTFREQVINSDESYTCKHVLAAKLSIIIGSAKVETSADDVFTFSLQMIKPISIDE